MALPDYSKIVKGTAVTWMNTGGTKTMTLKNITNTTIKEGAKSASLIDGTYGMPEFLEFTFETKLQSAPTAGNEYLLYVGWSSSATAGTDNPGGLTGADASVSNADQLPQLELIGSIVCSNSLGTGVQRQSGMLTRPKKEYLTPVAQNSTGQTTTNVDSETIITMTPWYRTLAD